MRRILVLRGGALGDFIVTLPTLAALRACWPAARIELAGNATAAQLARRRGLLDAVHSQHDARWSSLYSTAPLPSDFEAWLAEFDLVVSYWPDPDGVLAARFPRHAQQQFLSASAMPASAPAAAHYAGALRSLGLEPPTFYSLAEATAPRAGTTLHPGSGSPRKNWPIENWLKLLRELPPPLTIVLGEVELETLGHAFANLTDVALLRQPPLEVLVDHLAHTQLFLGHDSGISHLAAACGAPSLLLFGPTDPAMWAPPVAHVRVLQRGPALSQISLDDVRTALRDAPAAHPAETRPHGISRIT